MSMVRQLRRERGYRRQRPLPAPHLPDGLLATRPDEVDEVVRLLRARHRPTPGYHRTVAIVPADPSGVAGYGLTVVARLACADRRVRRRFRDQIWWLAAGPGARDEAGTALRRHRRNVRLAGTSLSFDGALRSAAEDRVLGMYRRLLLVVDALPPGAEYPHGLLSGRRGHVNLLTAVEPATVPGRADVVPVDAAGIERAVRDALRARTAGLPAAGLERLAELGVFAEGAELPPGLVGTLWRSTGGLDPDDTGSLSRRLADLSLVRVQPNGTLTVDPVIRAIGRLDLGEERLAEANAVLVNDLAARLPPAAPLAGGGPERAWWRLDDTDRYLWRHLVAHLLDAGERAQAGRLAGDLRWVAERLVRDGPVAPFGDLTLVAQRAGGKDAVRLRKGLTKIAPLLDPTDPPRAVVDILLYRLQHHPAWGGQARALQSAPDRPILVNRPADHPLTRAGPEIGAAWDIDLGPDGSLLAVAGGGAFVTCLDLATGERRHLACGAREAAGRVEFSPDGSWLAARTTDAPGGWGAEDPPAATHVYVWDVPTGRQRFRLTGWYAHQIWSFAVGLDSTCLFTRAEDGDRAWDAGTGERLATFPATGARPSRTSLRTETTSPDGAWRATVHDNELRLWDLAGDRPGPMMRVEPSRHDRLNGTVWLPDNGLLGYGGRGLYPFEIRRPGAPP